MSGNRLKKTHEPKRLYANDKVIFVIIGPRSPGFARLELRATRRTRRTILTNESGQDP